MNGSSTRESVENARGCGVGMSAHSWSSIPLLSLYDAARSNRWRQMKQTLRTIALIAALSSFGVRTQAEIVVLSDNFDSYPLGAFGSAYNFGDAAASPSSAIVAPGAAGTGQA